MILLGKKIKKLRNEYRYTQAELAKLIGVTKSTIAAYENDTRLPSYEVLVKLSRTFKVSLDYIVLDKQMETICVNGLNEEQIGAIHTLIAYYKHSRIIDNFYKDKPLEPEEKRILIEEYSNKDISEIMDDLTKRTD